MTVFSAVALAYPTGMTSDNPVVASGASGQVDICNHGDSVHLVYTASGNVQYQRSADKGSSWSSPVNLGTGGNPQVASTSTGNLFVAYSNNSVITVRRSTDGGVSWDGESYATVNATTAITTLAITRNGDQPAICYQRNNSYDNPDVYYATITSGTLTEVKASHDRASDSNTNPRIAFDGARYIVVWATSDGLNQQDSGIWYRWSNAGSDAELVGNPNGHSYNNPDIVWHGVSGQIDVAYVDYSGGTAGVYLKSYSGGWSGAVTLYSGGSNQLTPRVVPCSSGVTVISTVTVPDVLMANASVTTLYKSVGYNPTVSTCCESTTSNAYYAIADGGRVVVKRGDTVAPAATTQAPSYASSNVTLSFAGVTDDWTVSDPSGNSNDGVDYTNGVTSIQAQYSPTSTGPWHTIGNPITSPPWFTTITGLGDGHWYLRGGITDTAGNTGYTTSVPVIVDTTPPTATLTTDTIGDGWRKSATVTITGADANLDRLEYKVDGGNWTRYTAPFAAQQGQHNYGYRAVDKAGNTSGNSANQSLWVDSGNPSCQWDYPAGDVMQADRTDHVSLHASGSDGTSGVIWIGLFVNGQKVAEDGGAQQGCYWDVSSLRETTYTLTVKARDAAGNETTSTKQAKLQRAQSVFGDLYFAEGTTRPGFDEYLCVLNPDAKNAANLTLSFQLETGQVITKSASVPAGSRATFHVPDYVPAGHDVSTKIHSTGAYVVAERPMYFNYRGWTGGHTAVGINQLQKDFYFAEGTTRSGFDEYLTLQNPGDATANTTITYMLGTGKNVQKGYQVNPHARLTVNVASDVGTDQDVSAKVHSDQPIAAERPMYFNYHGKWDGGHDVVGVTAPQQTWYFAEGSTRSGFDEWLCIQNPGGSAANVTVNYSTGTVKKYSIAPHSRYTANVNAEVGADKDVSVTLTSDQPVIAERPMYFNFNGLTGGSDAVGVSQAGKDFYFAEGTTRPGFSEYLTVLTTAGSGNVVNVLYMFPDGKTVNKEHKISSNRYTVNVNEDAGANQDVAVRITADPTVGNKFVVERPMYFNYRGWTGGSTVAGTTF
jgi:hypothetical protein